MHHLLLLSHVIPHSCGHKQLGCPRVDVLADADLQEIGQGALRVPNLILPIRHDLLHFLNITQLLVLPYCLQTLLITLRRLYGLKIAAFRLHARLLFFLSLILGSCISLINLFSLCCFSLFLSALPTCIRSFDSL